MLRWLAVAVPTLCLIGCRGEQPAPARPPARPGAPPPVAAEQPKAPEVKPTVSAEKVLVKLETAKGVIELELEPAAAPRTVENFVKLMKEGFYNGMPFHRVEPGFVIQAGDPGLVGKPPVGYTIPDEQSPIKHTRGVIAMARSYRGGAMVPNSASTQFYITLGAAPHLDDAGFTAFGRVTKGMEVCDGIAVGDKIAKASVVE